MKLNYASIVYGETSEEDLERARVALGQLEGVVCDGNLGVEGPSIIRVSPKSDHVNILTSDGMVSYTGLETAHKLFSVNAGVEHNADEGFDEVAVSLTRRVDNYKIIIWPGEG
jgi:hypothetical protein